MAAFPLAVSQNAYQREKSTETALHEVFSYIEAGMVTYGAVMATLIDILGAFNNTPHDAIDNGARDHGINGTIRLWLGEYLKHRYVVSEHGFSNLSGKVSRGCPQGGVLSPKLWCLTVNKLLTMLEKAGIKEFDYSDDIIILTQG